MSENEFRSYWFTLKATGVVESDEILQRLAHAGKSFHSTDQWADEQDFLDGKSFVELIQEAADANAAEILRLREMNAGLEPLARLGLEAVEECSWQGCNFDGGDIQESAVKAGAIQESAEGYDPAIHGESDICDPGDRWYEFTPVVMATKAALEGVK